MTRRLFCFGFGFSAAALARRLQEAGDWRIAGTSRSAEKRQEMAAAGIEAHAFGPGLPLPEGALQGATHILHSIPPGEEGDPVHAACLPQILAQAPAWFGYLSTTGVYGDSGGAWVDEETPCRPTQARSQRRLAAEGEWLAACSDHFLPVQVFRLAGIYGPGRSSFDALRQGRGRRIDRPGHMFSRIHVDDIAAALEAAIERPVPGRIYNLCDDEPVEPAAVTAHAARLLGLPPPPLQDYAAAAAEMSPMARSFWADNRRVRNDRLKQELLPELAYPTYREGLAAVLAAERGEAAD
ncbi:NAD-dependent epimerase/dehydratase family protein [Marinibaculum pumilum]|uniref:NAD-dependent epimerase/dehydratase family protein n=1 Tax=Marinibaculum pumilum TaxID=1766165 RepID=A0ABV7L752_9PROT